MTRMKGWRAYIDNKRGNAAMIFALCLIPLFAVVGSVLDLNRQKNYQYDIQYALDFAVVATARHALTNETTDDELKQIAQDFFDGKLKPLGEASLQPVTLDRDGDLITLDVSGQMPTTVMQIVGQETMPLGTEAAAIFGEPSSAEIALVLDTSYSMSGSRISTLRVAANDMIDSLVKEDSDAVKMSIVPFATYVNVGTDKKGESWLTVEADKTSTSKNCWIQNSWYKKNCKRESYSCSKDGKAKTCKRWVCDPAEKAAAPRTCKTQTKTQTWHGCVKSRSAPHNVEDTQYSTKPVGGFITSGSWACPTPVRELTSDIDDLKDTVKDLNADQDTYIATGLTWGYRTLTDNAPFSEALSKADLAAKNGRKALVLMSDGANTKSPKANGKHDGNDKIEANNITEDVCDEIKSDGIELYTIAFEIDDSATKTLLRNCATDPDFYYDAKNSADLKQAFEKIGESFRDIALAK